MLSPSNKNTAETWVGILEKRLVKLADTASKESIQALAKWIGFRRKYAKEFSAALAAAIENPSSLESSHSRETRQWLYLQILHESILLDSGTSRWDRLAEMREILGEFCMMEVAKRNCLDSATITKVEGLIKQWDGLNVFGGPTLISMIKKQLTAAPSSTTPATTAAAETARAATPPPRSPKRGRRSPSPKPVSKKQSTPPPNPDTTKEEIQQAQKTSGKSPESKSPAPSKSPNKNVVYDFESKVRNYIIVAIAK